MTAQDQLAQDNVDRQDRCCYSVGSERIAREAEKSLAAFEASPQVVSKQVRRSGLGTRDLCAGFCGGVERVVRRNAGSSRSDGRSRGSDKFTTAGKFGCWFTDHMCSGRDRGCDGPRRRCLMPTTGDTALEKLDDSTEKS